MFSPSQDNCICTVFIFIFIFKFFNPLVHGSVLLQKFTSEHKSFKLSLFHLIEHPRGCHCPSVLLHGSCHQFTHLIDEAMENCNIIHIHTPERYKQQIETGNFESSPKRQNHFFLLLIIKKIGWQMLILAVTLWQIFSR